MTTLAAMSDPFALLDLPRRPYLGSAAIRAAFQARARVLHPDASSGNAEEFAALNEAQSTLADPAARLRLLVGEGLPIPAMPADFQLGFRVAEALRKVGALQSRAAAGGNVLARALLAQEAATMRKELAAIAATLEESRSALDTRLRDADEAWPNTATTEIAALAGEYLFLSRWQDQMREGRLLLQISFA
jgi:curved DNA-binding protein CbpA